MAQRLSLWNLLYDHQCTMGDCIGSHPFDDIKIIQGYTWSTNALIIVRTFLEFIVFLQLDKVKTTFQENFVRGGSNGLCEKPIIATSFCY